MRHACIQVKQVFATGSALIPYKAPTACAPNNGEGPAVCELCVIAPTLANWAAAFVALPASIRYTLDGIEHVKTYVLERQRRYT